MRFAGTGLAAIVGPNGCGKSNLSDAISWVLGEQSAKSLRGSRMEDVIFAGTRDRKPLSMAQVTMTLVDQDGVYLPQRREAMAKANGHANGEAAAAAPNGSNGKGENGAPHPHEITITRRLFRNGESEYLIDGRPARLRDIQDIFMGTGLGPESYAIIEQGRIGQLLSSKPQDRRAVIEEAAGVSKFKTRRRLAEAKLESAKQNLARVFDILEEVGRQANSLKRQAAKAKRYHELREEMTGQLRLALANRYRVLEREAAQIALELGAANRDYQSLSEQVAAKEREQHALQETLYQRDQELTTARQRLSEHNLEAERARGRIESQTRQVADIESRLTQGEAEAQSLEATAAAMAQDIEAHRVNVGELEGQVEEARRLLEAKTGERNRMQAALREREERIERGRQQILRLLGESSALKNQLAQIETHLSSLDRDRLRVKKEEESASGSIERLTARKKEISELLAARQMELESIGDQLQRVESALVEQKTKAVEARRALETIHAEASRVKARKDSLEEILSHRAYTTESVKRLFGALERGEVGNLKPLGVLADFVEVEAAYEKAAEEFLHDELEYVVVSEWSEAETGIDLMRSDLDGRATFLIHPEPGANMAGRPTPEPPIGPETGIVARLSEVLRMTNGLTQAPSALLPRLARCFLAAERRTAQRLALQYPDYYFLLPDGVCYHGHAVSGGRKTGSGPLALKRELRELTAATAAKQRELEETSRRIEGLERDIQKLSEEQESLRSQRQRQEKEALALDHEMRKLAEEMARANQMLSVARLEMQRIEHETERSRQQQVTNLAVIEERDRARAAEEEALAAARRELEQLQAQAAQLGEEHSVLRVELAAREERQRSERAAQSRLETQAAVTERRRRDIGLELERLGVERARLLASNMELDQLLGALEGNIAAAEEEVARLVEEDNKLRASLQQMEETLQQLRAGQQQAQERRSQIEVSLVERKAALRYLDETCQKELSIPVAELAVAEETVLDEAGLAEAEEKYNQLRSRIESLGPVNPEALQQYEEAQQRYDFLNAQRQDLLDSIRDTEKAIQEIDSESKRRFTEAFAAINKNFRETFVTLFGGGVAEMRLTDESNVNESGIDIVASPPGKRLQNVLLLSGGEKALTALALLMAIFRYQPSPFCVLDEVDAPLDEPNIQRLMGLLREMAGQTQFIIITHAKRTMEAASALYGVTMQEPGVSRLVSVRFQSPPPVANGHQAVEAHA
jgi:chromosome segregation protein